MRRGIQVGRLSTGITITYGSNDIERQSTTDLDEWHIEYWKLPTIMVYDRLSSILHWVANEQTECF